MSYAVAHVALGEFKYRLPGYVGPQRSFTKLADVETWDPLVSLDQRSRMVAAAVHWFRAAPLTPPHAKAIAAGAVPVFIVVAD